LHHSVSITLGKTPPPQSTQASLRVQDNCNITENGLVSGLSKQNNPKLQAPLVPPLDKIPKLPPRNHASLWDELNPPEFLILEIYKLLLVPITIHQPNQAATNWAGRTQTEKNYYSNPRTQTEKKLLQQSNQNANELPYQRKRGDNTLICRAERSRGSSRGTTSMAGRSPPPPRREEDEERHEEKRMRSTDTVGGKRRGARILWVAAKPAPSVPPHPQGHDLKTLIQVTHTKFLSQEISVDDGSAAANQRFLYCGDGSGHLKSKGWSSQDLIWMVQIPKHFTPRTSGRSHFSAMDMKKAAFENRHFSSAYDHSGISRSGGHWSVITTGPNYPPTHRMNRNAKASVVSTIGTTI